MTTNPPRPLHTLYPEIEPYDTGFLRVDDIHELYYEQVGNPAGKPVVFVHGGPGGGVDANCRRFFDPAAYRIVLFDQRGCGQSRPHACLERNTTWHLVHDMEALREHLGIERWQLFGGSWGSALSLAYAETHPTRVTELVLRGIFTLRRKELLWFYQEGASRLFPDAWEEFVAPIPEVERGDMISSYYRRLTDEDEAVRLACAQAWSTWEGRTTTLRPDKAREAGFERPHFALAFARIECHYFIHGGFLRRDDQLLHDASRLAGIPGVIVQGRYDVCCPVDTAWELHKRWPEARLHIVDDAGHTAMEPGIVDRLVEATDGYRP